MSAFVEKELNGLRNSNIGENVMEHSMDVLFFEKYHGRPGERLIVSDYNGRYNKCH